MSMAQNRVSWTEKFKSFLICVFGYVAVLKYFTWIIIFHKDTNLPSKPTFEGQEYAFYPGSMKEDIPYICSSKNLHRISITRE